MKATQAKATENSVKEQKCRICGKPTTTPYGMTQAGEFLCSRLCDGAWEQHQRRELLRHAPKESPAVERRRGIVSGTNAKE